MSLISTKSKIPKKTIAIIIGIAISAAIVGGGYFLLRKKEVKRTFKEVRVEQGDLDVFVQATGQVQPENRLVVKPAISGRIESVLIEEGKPVKAGQILAWMSSSDRAALLDMARAKGADEVRHWEEIYKPSPVIAPLSGFVITKGVEQGQVVGTGDVAFVISDRLVINAQVDETDLGRVRLGQDTSIQLDAYSDLPIAGKVSRIAFEARTQNNVTIYDIRVLPENVPDFMRSGMTASVKFMETTRKNIFKVPTSLFKNSKTVKELRKPGSVLKVLSKTGENRGDPQFEELTVKLGTSDGRMVEVTEGLKGTEILLDETTPESGDKPGSPFNPFGGTSKRPNGKGTK